MNSQSEPALSFANDCLAGGGEMGALMRSMDWSKTSIGAVESWSPALRMMVRLLLANRFPLLLWWGPRYCQLYNDPYRLVLGDKHPASMGQPASECFPEIWDVIGPLIDTPFNGGSGTWMDDLQLEYIRYDRLEEAHFTVAYSPVPDETVPSGIGGVLATVHEITEQVVGERRSLTLRELGSRFGEAKTAEEACVIAAGTLARHPEDVPFALLYLLDGNRTQAHLAGAAGIEMGKAESPLKIDLSCERSRESTWPLAETVRSETMQIVEDLQGKLSSVPPGPWSDPPHSAVVWPIRSNMAHQLAGLLVLGLSSRLEFDDRYRDFCELIASQVATAIANASELVAELTAMNRLHQLSTRLLRETELQPLLEEVLNATMALQDADFGNVQLYNPRTQELEIVAQRGFGQDFLDHFSAVNESSAACGRALQSAERVIIEDVLTDPDFEPHRAIAASVGYRAVQSTPLFNRSGEPLGMISTHFRRPHRPLERELRLTDLYALQAAELIERKHAEDALRASEERFRRYFELGLIGMMTMTSPTKGILEVNDELCRILGYERSELLQMTWAEMTHPDDLAADVAQFNRVMAGEIEGYSLDKRWIRKDGRVINSIMAAKCLRRADGSVDYFVGLVLDITERKRAEERIRELGAIVESSDDAILGKTLDGIITSWNKGAEKIYGYAENEVIGQPISILVPTDRQDELPQICDRLALGEAIDNFETVRRRKDGEEIHVSLTISPIRNCEGRIVGASSVARDITRRKRIDGALRQSEQRFAAFMDNLPGFAWMKDIRGRYTYLNKEMARLPPFLGDWLGKTDADLWPSELAVLYQASDQQVIAGRGALQTMETYLIDGDKRSTLVSKFPMVDPAGAVVLVGGVGIDITERKRLEQEILAVSEREQRRIGQDLHDDLCQRLAGIQLMADVLQRDLLHKAKPEAEQAGLIAARIRDAIANTKNIARGLSPVALESNGLTVALQELADNSAKLFQISCKFRFDGCVAVDDNTVATHLYRIAQEAVTNAIKHGSAKKIVIRLAELEDKCTLTITDDGVGLPESFAKNKGTGLHIMKYRAATIGASLEIGRAGRRGICVSCSFRNHPRPKDS